MQSAAAKATIKKKKKKLKDVFEKKKAKLGRKVQKSNATNITVKSSTISVPMQSICEDKEGESVNSRNLTLQDLIVQTRHYNSKKQRDALLGMKDLFAMHADQISLNLNTIFTAISPMIVKEDIVRKALKEVMGFLFPKLKKRELMSFLPLLRVHLRSGLSHVLDDVRMDSLKIVDMLIQSHPFVAQGFAQEMMSHFLHLLCGIDASVVETMQPTHQFNDSSIIGTPVRNSNSNNGTPYTPRYASASASAMAATPSIATTTTTTPMSLSRPRLKSVSAEQRASVLSTIHTFLKALIEDHEKMEQKDLEDEQATKNVTWKEWEPPLLQLFAKTQQDQEQKSLKKYEHLNNFAKVCLPLLVDVWVECGLPLLVSGSSATCLRLCANLMRMLVSLPTVRTQPWLGGVVPLLQRHVVPFFPIRDVLGGHNEELTNDIDACLCSVLSIVGRSYRNSNFGDLSSTQQQQQLVQMQGLMLWDRVVVGYIASRLSNSAVGGGNKGRRSSGMKETESIELLLPVIADIIGAELGDNNNDDDDDNNEKMKDNEKMNDDDDSDDDSDDATTSIVGAFAQGFVNKNLPVQPSLHILRIMAGLDDTANINANVDKYRRWPHRVSSHLRKCLLTLGRMLFEADPDCCESILSFLLSLASMVDKEAPLHHHHQQQQQEGLQVLKDLAPSLCPFFYVRLRSGDHVAGLFFHIPRRTQRLAMHLLSYLPVFPPQMTAALTNVVSLQKQLDPDLVVELLEILSRREDAVGPEEQIVMIVKAVLPNNNGAPTARDIQMIAKMADHMRGLDFAAVLPRLVIPGLLEHPIMTTRTTDGAAVEWGWLLLDFLSGCIEAGRLASCVDSIGDDSISSIGPFVPGLANAVFNLTCSTAATATNQPLDKLTNCSLIRCVPSILSHLLQQIADHLEQAQDTVMVTRIALTILRNAAFSVHLRDLCELSLSNVAKVAKKTSDKDSEHVPQHIQQLLTEIKILTTAGIISINI